MREDQYHHGDLKQELIDKGLLLLNEEGIEGFSLRKVAKMCGVSHAAPYKHFKDKDALISEIIKEVWKKLYLSLVEVTKLYSSDAKLQLVEMGKTYVKFMTQNPQYLKFMFLSDNNCSVDIKNGEFFVEDAAFEVLKNSAEVFFKETKLDKKLYMQKILGMWSLVHGLTILITQKNLRYDGDYLDLVGEIIESNI
ncbi:TetR/AcrR family transcriptional regulator [Clostridium neuense]|uniref:TetR/AcrR family transcriptional regulator n=1 Tax=Clostridium neuense TaxID=1728934 RepID=A0ABW8TER9_9CLOT